MTLDQIVDVLALAAPFVTLDKEHLKLIGFVSEVKEYEADAVVVEEGDSAKGAFILVSGTLQAEHSGINRPAEKISAAGSAIGELALLVEQPRPATIRAVSKSTLLFVPRQHFKRLLENYPDLAQKVSDQIKHAMQKYVGALGQVNINQ